MLISSLLRLPKRGGREEAVVLFTSGTTGEPKGVVLSHRNIISNVKQFRSIVDLDRTDTLMASLPFFHCLVARLRFGTRCVAAPEQLRPIDVGLSVMLETPNRLLLRCGPTFRATESQRNPLTPDNELKLPPVSGLLVLKN